MKRRWRRIVIGVLLVLLIAYVNSYIALSRRGISQLRQNNGKQFFYCRFENLTSNDPNESHSAARFHNFCFRFFAPLNYLDVEICSGARAAFPITDIP
jgi:hypothetical protein